MGYPGEQGKTGDWPAQPPYEPYGPGGRTPEAAPYGDDASPFRPRGDEPVAGGAHGEPGAAYGGAGSEHVGAGAAYGGTGGAYGGADDGPFDADPGAYPPDPYAGDGFGTGPYARPGEGRGKPERRRNLPLIIGAAAVAGLVLVGGGIGLSSMLEDDPKPKKPTAQSPSPSAKPTTPATPSVPPLEPVKLKSRATDPKPLTLSEVFGKKTFKAGKQKYVRTAWNAKRGCTGIVGGAALVTALKKGSCSQALRATYALSNGKLIGTVGVLNLKTEAAAKQAVKAAAAKDAYLRALPGTGITRTNGKGEALGTSEARGHYVVMTWVQRPDGKKIASSYHPVVSAFGAQLVKGSDLAFALAYRETEGKPLQK
ncbi:hypothetical protein [Spirillospora albida]|uniref:hypothetical protein n=1 Tax=Spirillospora albida TaxID=58123 RepID=UPI0004BFC716|nr:hypothetical protein [Spirillospora albida]